MTYQIIIDQDDFCKQHNYVGVHMSHSNVDAKKRSKSAQGKSAQISGYKSQIVNNFPMSDGDTRSALCGTQFGFEIVNYQSGRKGEFLKEDSKKPGMTGDIFSDVVRALNILKTGKGDYYAKNDLPTLRPSQKDEELNWQKFLKSKTPNYLIGAAPRWGKTIPSLKHAYDCMKQTNSRFVLYVSGKLDTKTSVQNHCAKYDFGFMCHIMNDQSQNWHDLSIGNWLIYASIQDIADLRSGELKKKFSFLKDNPIAAIIFDEAHVASQTLRTQKFFEYLQPHYTIYITGTPFGLVDKGYFSRGALNTFFYDIIDERNDKLKGIINSIDVPDITYFIPKDDILNQAEAKSYRELFDDDIENGTNHIERLIKNWFIKTIIKQEKVDWETGTLNLENEINGTYVHNAIIVCPSKIKYCEHLMSVLTKIRNKYPIDIHYVKASGQNVGDDDEVIIGSWYDEFVKLTNEQTLNRKNNFNFLITLGRGCQAVDYPNVQAVIMLNNSESPEQYVQSAFRAKTGNGKKTVGLVIDYDRNRVLKMVHKQVEAHIDDNIKLSFNEKQVNELYKSFSLIEKTDSGFENIPLFFEDIMHLFNGGDYASDLDLYIDEKMALSLSQWFGGIQKNTATSSNNSKAPKKGKKPSIKQQENSGTNNFTKKMNYLEQAKKHFAQCLVYLPSYFAADPIATVSNINEQLFEKMTGIQGQFWLKAITNVPNKALTKIELEAKQIAKNEDYKIRTTGESRPVPIELANKMKSYVDTKDKEVLVICGGLNLLPKDAKNVTYIDDNEVNCELVKGKVKKVIYSTNILQTLESLI
jgi:superfamily II DNA or RNA helicase